jgi:putative transposase
MDEVRSNNNVVYRCTYRVVWCPKYRRPVIEGAVDMRLQQIIRDVCGDRDAPVIELETMPDHVHLLVGCDPQYGIHRLVKQVKGRSSRVLRSEFPHLRSRLPTPLDQLLLRRHGRRRDPGGRQALCREPAERLNRHALSSPWLKPGVSRAVSDDPVDGDQPHRLLRRAARPVRHRGHLQD